MAAEKRGKVCWTQKTSLPSAVSFLSFFDEPHDFFDARAIDWFFSFVKGDKVCSHSSDLLHIREGTHIKNASFFFFPPHYAYSYKNLKTHTHARHHLATTTTTTGGDDDDRIV